MGTTVIENPLILALVGISVLFVLVMAIDAIIGVIADFWRLLKAAPSLPEIMPDEPLAPPEEQEIVRSEVMPVPPPPEPLLVAGAGPIVGRPVFGQTLMLGPESFLIHGYYVHTSPKGGAHDHVTGLSQYAMLMVRDGDTWRIQNVPQVAWKSSWPDKASAWEQFRAIGHTSPGLLGS